MHNEQNTSRKAWLIGLPLLAAVALIIGLTALAAAQGMVDTAVPLQEYTVTTSVSPTGSGTVTKSPDQATYTAGTEVTLTASASDGWKFVEWTGDVVGTTSPVTVTVNANLNVTANFARRCYKLTLQHTGEGSPPTASPTNSSTCPAGEYVAGESITLTAVPATGWQVGSWEGTSNNASTSPTNSLTMPTAAHTVTVNYVPICFSLTINVTPTGSGTVGRSPQPNCNGNRYTTGTEVTLTAEPETGFNFVSWSGGITGTTNPATVVMNGNRTVTATFEKTCYQLVLTHTGAGADPVASPTSSQGCDPGQYFYETEITLTADPDDGWQVNSWEGTDNDSSTSVTNSLTMPADNGYIAKVNYIERPTLQFNAGSYSVNEDSGSASIIVLRTGATSESVTVNVATSDGTAKANEDYLPVNETLTFAPNVNSRTVNVPILNDALAEGSQNLTVVLSNPSTNAKLGSPTTATLTILDDEGTPTVQFSSNTFSANEFAPTAPVTITLFPASAQTVVVDLSTMIDGGGSSPATPGVDYQPISQRTVRFNPGTTVQRVEVNLLDDALDEDNETLKLQLSNVFPMSVNLGESEAILTIVDDDAPPTVQFSAAEYYAKEGEPTATISVTLSAPSSFEITTNYEINDALQTNSTTLNALTFPAGETLATFDVPLGSYQKGDEIILVLRTPVRASLGAPSSAQLFVLDPNRSDCFALALTHTGWGADPVADLEHSVGCPEGTYVANELIGVTAVPADGWSIRNWLGTLNNNDKEPENVVRMPLGDHVVTVNYVTSLYMANVSGVYTNYFSGPSELEPNNTLSEANGPIRSNVVYQGTFTSNDINDLFFFNLTEMHSVQIALDNIVYNGSSIEGFNLFLYRAGSNQAVSGSANLANARETIVKDLEPGLYYVLIYNPERLTTLSPYNVRVIYE